MPRPQPDDDTTRPALRGIGLGALLVGSFLATYTFSSVNIALPDIERTMHAPPAALQLVMGAYGISFALLLILGGRLGDRFGRQRLFTIGLAAYVVTSTAAGLAGSIGWLIGLRALQGIAAAALVPQVLATIQAATTGPGRLRAIAAFSALAGLGTASGQVVGGVLLSADIGGSGWRSVIWFGAALGLLALPGAVRIPRTRSSTVGRTDVRGTLLLAVGVLALLVPLNVGPGRGWPPWSLLMLILCPLGLLAFWRHEHRITHAEDGTGAVRALVPPPVLRHRALRIGLVIVGLMFASYGAFMYEFALVTQRGLGLSPLMSGLWLTACMLSYAVVSARMSWFTRLFGSWTLVLGGAGIVLSILAAGAVLALGWPSPSTWLLQPALILFGGSQALAFNPTVTSVLEQIPAELAGLSGGLFSTVQQAALAFGVAIYGGLYTAAEQVPSLSHPGAFLLCMVVQAVSILVLVALAVWLRTVSRTTPV